MERQTTKKRGMWLFIVTAFLAVTVLCQNVAFAQVSSANGVTTITVNPWEQSAPDFVNATAMPMPSSSLTPDSTQATIQALLSPPSLGPSGGAGGGAGTGATSPVFLGTPAAAAPGVTPEDFGTTNHPFSTARADLFPGTTNTQYPYRAAGKLFFQIGTANYICSASLIRPGIVVTAAHCVAKYGARQFYHNWVFVPGYRNGVAPFGSFSPSHAVILTAYYAGTDSCASYGVICPDDVAILVIPSRPGNTVGWFGYWYGGGYTSGHLFQITQLGYPAGLDNAALMERNDSYGYTNFSLSNNTIIGSNMNGGSSGGPWVENFGISATLTGETNGSFPYGDVVVGVTSWGYISLSLKEQGASPFTFGNIQVLINYSCTNYGVC